ncbi:hypothetical protein Tco_0148082 [Tanacetum coccineum]
MALVRISSGPEPIMMLDLSSSSLVLYLMMFEQISSNLVSQMSQRRLLASLQAPSLTASADVPSSVTETTDTTSTLPPPPPPPPQKPTGHRDI